MLNKQLNTSKKQIFSSIKEEINAMKSQQVTITEIACLSGWEFEADNSPYGVYVTHH